MNLNSPAVSDVTGNSPDTAGLSEEQRMRAKAAHSDFLTAHAPERKSARLSSALLDYKRPDGLNLVPLGTTWAVDLFVRPHNGVRRELIDLYNMVDSFQRRVQEIRSQDLKLFFVWWDVFTSYLEAVFDLIDKLLIPWALGNSAAPEGLEDAVRAAGREHLNTLLKAFDVVLDQMPRRSPDESLAKIIKALTSIHPIFEFIEVVESKMPDVADSNHSAKQGRQMEKQVASFLVKHGDEDSRRLHLLIMARGMTEEVASAWKKRVPALLRLLSSSQNTNFRTHHLRCVDKLALVD
jgi:hypothetical protein